MTTSKIHNTNTKLLPKSFRSSLQHISTDSKKAQEESSFPITAPLTSCSAAKAKSLATATRSPVFPAIMEHPQTKKGANPIDNPNSAYSETQKGGEKNPLMEPLDSSKKSTTATEKNKDLDGDDTQHSSSTGSSYLANQSFNPNNIRMIMSTETTNTNATTTTISADPSSTSDQSSSLLHAVTTTHLDAQANDSSIDSFGYQAVKGIGHNPNGQYLLRQDVFLPQLQKVIEPNQANARNKLFFENIDAAFGKCSISMVILDEIGPILDANELKNMCKMCFGAMCIVFSSHNPSTTKMGSRPKEADDSPDTISVLETASDGSLTRHSKRSSAYQSSLDKDVFKTAIFMRHQRRLAGDDDISDSLHNIMIGFDHAGGSCGNSNHSSPSYDITSNKEINTNNGVDSLRGSLQRPAVPLAVVYMLWSKLIASQLEERSEGKNNDNFCCH